MEQISKEAFFAFALLGSLAVSLVLIPLCRRLALKLDIVDKPGGRKEHRHVTPLLGGLAVYISSLISLLIVVAIYKSRTVLGFEEDLRFWRLSLVFLGSTIVFLTGLLDDVIKRKTELAYYYKLIGQVAAAFLAMLLLAKNDLDAIFIGEGTLGNYMTLLFFVLWLLATMNAFNYSDNINGLMSGLAIIAILSSIVFLERMESKYIVLGFILVGAMIGFIPFNFPRARIFIGDAGSMFVGYWAGVFAWPLTQGQGRLFGAHQSLFGLDFLVAPFLILGLPLLDALFVLIIRLKEGRPIYLGDNQHLSHRLVRSGFSVMETTLLLWGGALIMVGLGAIAIRDAVEIRVLAMLLAIALFVGAAMVIMRVEKTAMEKSSRSKLRKV